MNFKKCNSCKEEKPISEYHSDKSRIDGKANRCKSCRCKYDTFVIKNCRACGDVFQVSGNAKAQVYCGKKCQDLYLKYGIDEYAYEDMLIHQNYSCAICRTEITSKNRNVDHCHKTGHVRGILCTPCNMALGVLQDDVFRLENAIKYLQEFEQNKPHGIRNMFCGNVRYIRKRKELKGAPVVRCTGMVEKH